MADLSHERRGWLPAYMLSIQAPTTALLGIRLLSRALWRGGGLGLDDLFITLGWAIGTANTGVCIYAAMHLGYDRHIWDVDLEEVGGAIKGRSFNLHDERALISLKYGLIISVVYLWSTSFTKVSILLFYRRLVAGTYSKRYRWAIWLALAAIIIHTIVIFSLTMVTCIPLEALWMRYVPSWLRNHSYYCAGNGSVVATSYATGIISVVTDLYTVLLPGWLFFKIQMSKTKRVATMSIFSIGFVVVIAGIVRTVYLVRAKGPDIDKTWNTFNVIVAGKAEGDFGIMCACAPSLKSAFTYHFGRHSPTADNRSTDPSTSSHDDDRMKLQRTALRKGYGQLLPNLRKPHAGSPAPTEEFILDDMSSRNQMENTQNAPIDRFGFNQSAWATRPLSEVTDDHDDGLKQSGREQH